MKKSTTKKKRSKNQKVVPHSFQILAEPMHDIIQWQEYSRAYLKAEPQIINAGEWPIQLHACAPNNSQLETLMVLLGPLESPNLYKHLAEKLYLKYNLLFVSLPSLGGNSAIDFKDNRWDLKSLSEFVQWLGQNQDMQSFHLMGASAAANVALHAAIAMPEQIKSLCLTGMSHRPGKIWQMLFNQVGKSLQSEALLDCADAALLYLVNDEILIQKRSWGVFRNYFRAKIQAFGPQQTQSFQSLIAAILKGDQLHNDNEKETPRCPVIAFTGEYDHLTSPHDHAEFIDSCIKGTFATVDDADHLLHVEKPHVVAELVDEFLESTQQSKPLKEIEGAHIYPPQSFLQFDRRRDPRYVSQRPKVKVETSGILVPEGWEEEVPQSLPARLRNINFSGCLIEIHDNRFTIDPQVRDIKLHLIQANLEMRVLAFEQVNKSLRCLFFHESYEKAVAFREILEYGEYFVDADLEADLRDDYDLPKSSNYS